MKIENAFDDELVQVTLKHVRLSDQPQFTAISYTWGTALDSRWIQVNGVPHRVRSNLSDILHSIRVNQLTYESPNQESWYWVDAICVQQDCLEEKSHQVAQTGKVYSIAHEVWAWLGNGQQTANALASYQEGAKSHHNQYAQVDRRISGTDYFRRYWTIQEAILAKRLRFFTRAQFCYLDDLGEYEAFPYMRPSAIFTNPTSITKDATALQKIMSMRISNQQNRHAYTDSVLDLMSRFYGAVCENPLDRVYSLQSLADPAARCSVDYRATAPEVYWRVLVADTKTCDFIEAQMLAQALGTSFEATSQTLKRGSEGAWTTEPKIFIERRLPLRKARTYTRNLRPGDEDEQAANPVRTTNGGIADHAQHTKDSVVSISEASWNLLPTKSDGLAVVVVINSNTSDQVTSFGLLLLTDSQNRNEPSEVIVQCLDISPTNRKSASENPEIEVHLDTSSSEASIAVSPRIFDQMCRKTGKGAAIRPKKAVDMIIEWK